MTYTGAAAIVVCRRMDVSLRWAKLTVSVDRRGVS
jgi:hypothetical protein